MQFKKYHSISRKPNRSSDCLATYGVTEKLHGANGSVYIHRNDDSESLVDRKNKVTMRFAKRGSFIDDEKFFGATEYLESLRARFTLLSDSVEKNIIVYGELAGNHYPHKDVPIVSGHKYVQKGIWYSPTLIFYIFDIVIEKSDGMYYMAYDEMFEKCTRAGLMVARLLARGSYDEVCNYNPRFQSTIPGILGLPPLEKNLVEGVVIKELGEIKKTKEGPHRSIFKIKNDDFSEGTIGPRRAIAPSEETELVKELSEMISPLLNERRLEAVMSKDLYDRKPKHVRINIFAGLMIADAIADIDDVYFVEKMSDTRVSKRVKLSVTGKAVEVVRESIE